MKKFLILIPFILYISYFVVSQKKTDRIYKPSVDTSADTSAHVAQSHSLKPVISNQWYSSLYKYPLESQPMFAYPLAYKVTTAGIGFSYPDISASAKTVFGMYNEDFTLGLGSKIEKRDITAVGDWSIGLKLSSGDSTMAFSLTQGVPYTVVHTNSKFEAHFTDDVKIYDENKIEKTGDFTSSALVAVVHNHNYIFASEKPMKVTFSGKTLSFDESSAVMVGILDSRSHFDLFKSARIAEILSTEVKPTITADSVVSEYVFQAKDTPLVAVLPHQAQFLKSSLKELGRYHSLRGDLKLYQTTSFTTVIPRMKVKETFSNLKESPSELTKQIHEDINAVITAPLPESRDYFFGTWLGKVSNLLQLSETFGLKDDNKKLLIFVEPVFLDALTTLNYDKSKTSVISAKPEFGNEVLNDHHFHYGYFVRAAGVISLQDPTFKDKVAGKLALIVKDIANSDRSSEEFPFTRNFAVYEGHSWADGFANFGDGNDQESTSEAINAWYGLYVWAKASNDTALQEHAEYLLNTEIQSTYEYWFNKNNVVYKAPYEHAMASIVWGGKADFGTWFSGETNMIYGIQFLPYSPVSEYLGGLKNFDKYDNDITKNGGGVTKDWGDLYLIFKSFYKPAEAFQQRNTIQKKEDSNSRSTLLYYLYLNKELR